MKYKHLFFDLDGTLWDLKRNTRLAMEIMFDRYASDGLHPHLFEDFFRRYHHHNDEAWALYSIGKIEKHVLRVVRFERAFGDVQISKNDEFIERFASEFLDVCPRQPNLLEGTIELLEHCRKKYKLHIITNGFREVQGVKMKTTGIEKYFEKIINSEDVGVRKPDPAIFTYALQKAGAEKEESLMIGDDWNADILGARDSGLDQVFINTTERMMHELGTISKERPGRHNYQPTFSIESLTELLSVL
ncbi:MAG: noncanonical pyrimidine nucleotidase, YjjG family [Crocinitomicaceae bacterium]|nr:noncanonical pyrimidine nucleotidase, YjjG family [Crocinitomicaceae bacterium]